MSIKLDTPPQQKNSKMGTWLTQMTEILNTAFDSAIYDATDAINQTITLNDVVETDIVIMTSHTIGANSATLKLAKCVSGGIYIEFNVAPGAGHKLNYLLIRNR